MNWLVKFKTHFFTLIYDSERNRGRKFKMEKPGVNNWVFFENLLLSNKKIRDALKERAQ